MKKKIITLTKFAFGENVRFANTPRLDYDKSKEEEKMKGKLKF